jgi:arylsulfatase A-like enzyme
LALVPVAVALLASAVAAETPSRPHHLGEAASAAARQAPRRPPNVLFIAIDDQNDWIGALGGHPQARTPRIDRLAARGTLFTNAHAQAPLCNPSRTSLMLGLRPSTTGVYGLAPWIRDVEQWQAAVSLPQYLRKHGFVTYSTGKIYHAGYGRRPADREFDVLGPPASVGPTPPRRLADSGSEHPLVDWGVFPHRDEDKGDWKVADWAIERLREPQANPFFLSVGFYLPHLPLYVTQKWYDMYPDDQLVLPPVLDTDRDDTPRFSWYLHWSLPEPRLAYLKTHGEWRNLVRCYLASVSFVDEQIGRVLDALEASAHADSTVVVLWSDHGFHLGEKGITGKNSLWERSTRVPLVFAGPGVVRGASSARPVELLDIYPTLIELLGLPPKTGLEGASLVPLLRDARARRDQPAITTHNPGNHSVRSERWRYIRYADGTEELYDLLGDPNEWRNLAGDPSHASVVAEHKRWLPASSAPPAPGSRDRVLTFDNGIPVWEGQRIEPKARVPGT